MRCYERNGDRVERESDFMGDHSACRAEEFFVLGMSTPNRQSGSQA